MMRCFVKECYLFNKAFKWNNKRQNEKQKGKETNDFDKRNNWKNLTVPLFDTLILIFTFVIEMGI